jgi:hypothetical protein
MQNQRLAARRRKLVGVNVNNKLQVGEQNGCIKCVLPQVRAVTKLLPYWQHVDDVGYYKRRRLPMMAPIYFDSIQPDTQKKGQP